MAEEDNRPAQLKTKQAEDNYERGLNNFLYAGEHGDHPEYVKQKRLMRHAAKNAKIDKRMKVERSNGRMMTEAALLKTLVNRTFATTGGRRNIFLDRVQHDPVRAEDWRAMNAGKREVDVAAGIHAERAPPGQGKKKKKAAPKKKKAASKKKKGSKKKGSKK